MYRHFLHTRGKKLQKSDWCEIIILEDSTFRIRRVSWIYQKHFFLFSFTLSSCLQIPTLNKLTLRWADCSGLTTQSSDRAAWSPAALSKHQASHQIPTFFSPFRKNESGRAPDVWHLILPSVYPSCRTDMSLTSVNLSVLFVLHFTNMLCSLCFCSRLLPLSRPSHSSFLFHFTLTLLPIQPEVDRDPMMI